MAGQLEESLQVCCQMLPRLTNPMFVQLMHSQVHKACPEAAYFCIKYGYERPADYLAQVLADPAQIHAQVVNLVKDPRTCHLLLPPQQHLWSNLPQQSVCSDITEALTCSN